MSISNKMNNMIMNFRFMAKRIRPTIMSIIINQHKIKFIILKIGEVQTS